METREFIELNINNQNFVVRDNITIIETCKFTGIQIPRFCYKEGLAIAGNCRMCLVHLALTDKLVVACLTDVESELEVSTDCLIVKKARENIISTLLLNHPLDCPICDQAGECDLQDQTKNYGSFKNKMYSKRRGVEDKHFNFFIKTIMTRCIHCTRCVRFSTDILGVETFGTLMRGNATEIGSYKNQHLSSNMTGNLIDLCPVGALTGRTHAFKGRPWELKSMETIDLSDSISSPIFVNYKGSKEIIRILPKSNDTTGTLISDKTRFSFDGLYSNRVFEFSDNLNKKFLKYYNSYILQKKANLLIVIDEYLDLETIQILKFLTEFGLKGMGVKLRSAARFKEFRNINLFINDSIISFDKDKNNCAILAGSSDKTENEIINTKIRIKSITQNYLIYSTHYKYSLKKENMYVNLNNNETFLFFEGKNRIISKLLNDEKSPQIFIGENFKKRYSNTLNLKRFLKNVNKKMKLYAINSSPNTEGNFFFGIKSFNYKDLDENNAFCFININDNIILRKLIRKIDSNKLIVWFNSHYTEIIDRKNDIVLELKSNYFEKKGTYINLEQRFQQTQELKKKKDILDTITNFLIELNLLPSNIKNSILNAFNGTSVEDKGIKTLKFPKQFHHIFDLIKTDNFIHVRIPLNDEYDFIVQKSNPFFTRIYVNSFSRFILSKNKMGVINKYPIKLQNDSKKNIHLNNSHGLNIETLQQRFNTY